MRRLASLSVLLLAVLPAFADTWAGGKVITSSERVQEAKEKDRRIMAIMKARGLDALLLTKFRNQAWALAGSDTRIVHSQSEGAVWLLYTPSGRKYLIASNIEAKRLMNEEGLGDIGVEPRVHPWHFGIASGQNQQWVAVTELVGGGRVGADGPLPQTEDVSAELARARFPLTATEIRKMRWLGTKCGAIAGEVCREIAPGMSEEDIGGVTAAKLWKERIFPTVILVGVDGRLMEYRHLTPTARVLRKYALVNLCAERWGLVVAVSRLVHFGDVSPELGRKIRACAQVDAAALAASRPGAKFGEVFAAETAAYGKAGFSSEWKQHHQGGAIGYFEREFLACPESGETVVEGMALAWNPTIRGVKVEDTVLVGRDGVEILTPTPDWPMIRVEAGGKTFERPGILVRKAP